MAKKVELCRCGKIAKLEHVSENQGNYSIDGYFIECDCGMRTKVCSEYFFDTKPKCIDEAVRIWNQFNS